jgi:hypothetical protein
VDRPPEAEAETTIETADQALLGVALPSSCNDITGTDPVLAALAVSTASELGRWQPVKDFELSWGSLALSATGAAQCADGECFNTRALLELQKDVASEAEIRPGVKVNPRLLRAALTTAYARQSTCFSLLGMPFIGCGVPEHQFALAYTNEGTCDTNYWFDVQRPTGEPLDEAEMAALEKGLIWVNVERNEYVSFQVDGNKVGIDPTYGLNTGDTAITAVCSAACTKISDDDLEGQCCSCNGNKQFVRSTWNRSTYLCQ